MYKTDPKLLGTNIVLDQRHRALSHAKRTSLMGRTMAQSESGRRCMTRAVADERNRDQNENGRNARRDGMRRVVFFNQGDKKTVSKSPNQLISMVIL
jgi:hypothetical protein